MILQDLHTHSMHDDGHGTLMEMALSAEKMGMVTVGFSGHSPLPYENEWSIKPESLAEYLQEANEVKAAMAGRVNVLIGMEYDSLSETSLEGLDYVIGSVHHVKCGDEYASADESVESSEKFIAYFGSADKAAEAYFDTVGQLADKAEVDIIGHFDLITKFNERRELFDTQSEAYLAAAKRAMERLVRAGKIFEINSGAISRGYRTEPYPSKTLLKELCGMGGKITLTSDSHSPENLCYCFDLSRSIAKECGFTEVWQYIDGEFRPVEL